MKLVSSIKAKLIVIARPFIRFLRPAPPSHLQPVSRRWGVDRGTAIARYYIDQFIASHAKDIVGDILEVKNRRLHGRSCFWFGKEDVLDIDSTIHKANIITDLSKADSVPSNTYNCFILTETIQFIYDLKAAIQHSYRILKPGGVLLVSVPIIGPVDSELQKLDCWRLLPRGCQELFGEVFGHGQVQVTAFGNFATCVAGLSGLAFEELPPR